MSMLFDIGQDVRTRWAQVSADQAQKKASEVENTATDLRRRVEVMALTNQALFEILKARLGITEDDVLSRMAEIDMRDGCKDGKMTARVVACRQCGRKISSARLRCMFCGHVATDGQLFEKS